MTIGRIREIVNSASQLALSRYGQEKGRLKKDGTWVTDTDRIIEKFLRDQLSELFGQDAHIFGEESGWTGKESSSYTVIIDPIDGTAPFRDRIPIWGVSVAIFHKGQPWLGIFSMPAANHFFLGELGKGVQWNGETVKIPLPEIPIPTTSYLGVSSDVHQWNLGQYPGKIRAFGVSGFHVISVATGMLQAAMLTRFYFYDIAAGAIILWAAGGNLFYLSGQPVTPEEILQMQKPRDAVLACHSDAFEETRKYIQR